MWKDARLSLCWRTPTGIWYNPTVKNTATDFCASRSPRESGFAQKRTVELLLAGDAAAWEVVREKSVRMEMNRFRHSRIVRSWHVSEDELLSMLFEEMVGRGKLTLYRGEGDLYGWLGKYVIGYIHRANPSGRREAPACDILAEVGIDSAKALSCRDDRRFIERCFGALWRKSPVRAYAYYLKMGEQLSSQEVRDLLGLSSAANVDKLTSRFRKELREKAIDDA